MKSKRSYDFYLILATVLVLFIISVICIWAMFYFKMAHIQQFQPEIKAEYLERMNGVVTPFVVCLILLLGICVPKRLLSTGWLNRFAVFLAIVVLIAVIGSNVKMGLLIVLLGAFGLQTAVLVLAVKGGKQLHFEKKGYWLRVGSSLIHLGLILFILDIFLYRMQTLHLILFWITTVATTSGMGLCFYSGAISRLVRGSKDQDIL